MERLFFSKTRNKKKKNRQNIRARVIIIFHTLENALIRIIKVKYGLYTFYRGKREREREKKLVIY